MLILATFTQLCHWVLPILRYQSFCIYPTTAVKPFITAGALAVDIKRHKIHLFTMNVVSRLHGFPVFVSIASEANTIF